MEKFESINKTPNAFSIETICQSDNFIKNLFEVIESHQNETAIQFGKSIIYFIEDDFKSMLQCLEYLIELFPNITLLHRRIAEAHIYENNYQKAVPHLEKVLELDKEDLTANGGLTSFSNLIQTHLMTFYGWFTGRQKPRLKDILKICYCLNLTLLDFFDRPEIIKTKN